MHERRPALAASLLIVAGFFALSFRFALSEARRSRDFSRDVETPALGLAAAARLDQAAYRYRRAGEELLRDEFILRWIGAGEGEFASLRAFLEEVRLRHGLLDASMVSDRTETYYGSDGRVLRLSPENAERDGWYYLYRQTVLDTTIDAWYYPDTGVFGMYVNVPLMDRDGRYWGVVGGGIDTAEFSRILASLEEGRGLRVYLARRDGRLVYASDRSLLIPPARNLDELWGVRLADTLRREQRSEAGITLEPAGKGRGPVLWGRYLPEWDTFLVVERSAEELRSLTGRWMVASLAGEWALSLALLGLTLLFLNLDGRKLVRVERNQREALGRHQAVLHGQRRLLEEAERRLLAIPARPGGQAERSPESASLRSFGESLRRRRWVFEAHLRERAGDQPRAAQEPEELRSLATAVQEALLRASVAASRKGVDFHLDASGHASGGRYEAVFLDLALDELLEAALDLAAVDSELMLVLREDGAGEGLELALRLRGDLDRSRKLEATRLLFGAIGASLGELPAEPEILALRVSFPPPAIPNPRRNPGP